MLLIASASNQLVLDSTMDLDFYQRKSADSTITFSDVAVCSFKVLSVSHTIGFSDTLAPSNIKYPAVYPSVIELDHSVQLGGTQTASLTNTLTLGQTLKANLISGRIEQAVGLTQTVRVQAPQYFAVADSILTPINYDDPNMPSVADPDFVNLFAQYLTTIGLKDQVSVRRTITNILVEHTLKLSQEAAKVTRLVASNHLQFSDFVSKDVYWETVSDQLSFGQTIVAHNVRWAEQTLLLTQLAVANFHRARELESVLGLQSFATAVWIGRRNSCSVQVQAAHVLFTYPYVSPTMSVQLRNPNLGDRETLAYQRVNRRDMGGKLEIYRRSIWPRTKRLNLTFSSMTDRNRRDMLHFLNESLGKEIGYLDHEGRQWSGIVTTPAAKVQEMSRFCDHEVTLEFQGELV